MPAPQMIRYRARLPQLDGRFITDGGLETTLVYHEGIELPLFAAFVLLDRPQGEATLDRYFARYVRIAQANDVGVVLESATWRANPDWAAKLAYDDEALAAVQRTAIAQLARIRSTHETPRTPIVVSGNLGPRGDGYSVGSRMSPAEAADYHGAQIRAFAATEADMVAAFTMTYVEEAIGIASAAKANGMPAVISFTVETDGSLPSGESLRDAIERTDAATRGYPAYYMINCAHPSHFRATLAKGGAWRDRIRGVRANASKRSHAELDASSDLDAGTRTSSGATTERCCRCCRGCVWSGVAAAPITGTSKRSAARRARASYQIERASVINRRTCAGTRCLRHESTPSSPGRRARRVPRDWK